MPQAIPAIAAAAANAVSGAVYSGLTAIGVSAGTAALVSTYAASITAVSVATLAYVGPSLLFRPEVPTPEFARSVKRQPIPDRVSGYGRARLGGAYMLYETDGTNEGLALNVFAMHDGLIEGWGDIYLNDETVTVGGDTYVESGPDLRYGKLGDLVRIETRRGLPTETNYSAVTAARPSVWPSSARGDGIASLMMIAKGKEKENFLRDYPNGLPVPSAVGDLQYCWDPRLGDRGTITTDSDKEASATWVGGSRNPILQLLDFMTNESTGLGYPLSRFLPNIAAWEAAADVCDEAVPLAAGGTVPRYQAGGVYLHSTAPADVIATILATCDGWLAQDATGCFTVQAGEYVEPTVVITEEHIVGLSRQFYREDEKASNEIVISYTDPTFDYTEVETTPWRVEADIAARDEVRSQRLSLPWVQNNSQARRLAKIAATKATAPISGTLTTTLDGLRAWSERRIRIQAPSDGAAMADIVVDILPLTLNPDMTVSIPFVSCDPTAYDWTTAEETDGAGDDVRPPPDPLATPVIDSVVVFEETGSTARLRIYIEDATGGETYVTQWRAVGSTDWTQDGERTAVSATPHGYIETGLMPAENLEIQVAFVSAAGAMSDWSATETVDAEPTVLLVSMDFLGSAYINGVFTANSLSSLSGWAYSRAGVAYAPNSAGMPVSFAANTPRLTDKGLFVEAAATNVTTYSRDFSNAAWSKLAAGTGVAPVVSGTLVAAPDGSTTARSVAFDRGATDTGGNLSVLAKNDALTIGQTYVRSVWLRAATPAVYLFRRVGGGYQACSVTATWQRFSHSAVAGAASDGFQIGLAGGNGAVQSGTLEVWNAQTELGTAPSSEIETTTAAVTRPKDTATLTIAAGDGTDEISVDYVPTGSTTYARSTLSSPTVIDFADVSKPWIGKHITALEMVTT